MDVYYAKLELAIGQHFGWPSFITRTIFALTGAILVVGAFQIDQLRQLNKALSATKESSWKFRQFQLSYLVVYLVIMLADWLQGTNMYTLYSVSLFYPVFYLMILYHLIFIVLWCKCWIFILNRISYICNCWWNCGYLRG